MRKRRFTAEEKIRVLREAETGFKVSEVTKKNDISEQTYYCWKREYGGMTVPEARCLKALEKENSRLKRKLARQDALLMEIIPAHGGRDSPRNREC